MTGLLSSQATSLRPLVRHALSWPALHEVRQRLAEILRVPRQPALRVPHDRLRSPDDASFVSDRDDAHAIWLDAAIVRDQGDAQAGLGHCEKAMRSTALQQHVGTEMGNP